MIPTDAREPEAAWEFIKWMSSEEAWVIQSEAQKAFAKREWGPDALFVPFYSAHKHINEVVLGQYIEELPEHFREAHQVCMSLLPHSMHLPITSAASELWDAQANAALDATFHVRSPQEALFEQERRVQAALDRYYHPPTGPLLSVYQVTGTIIAINGVLLLIAIGLVIRGLRAYHGMGRRRALEGMAFISPWAFGFFVLILGPMLFSAVMAFTRYDVLNPPEFIGMDNWIRMFGFSEGEEGLVANDPQFWKSLTNTLYIVVLGVPITLVVSLALAMLLNTQIRGLSLYRTLFYVPVMTPAVVTAVIFIWMLNPETGYLNYILNALLRPFGLAAPAWFSQPEWAKPGIILMLTWGCGGTVIVWLAGLQTLPRQLYEAAFIDGANAWRRFVHITLPLLSPYALFLWVMGTIGAFQVFTQAYLIAAPGDSLLFYALYLFYRAFRYFEMGYASAMAWVLFVITVLVCLWQLRLAKKYVHYEGE